MTGIIIFLLSGAGEGTKTAMGTVILLMYLFGAIGFFMFKAFFVASAKETLMDSGTSPSGKYRYEVVNTEDSSNGSTAVYVEPNYADVRYPFTRFSLKNIKRVVFQDRPMTDKIEVEWEWALDNAWTIALVAFVLVSAALVWIGLKAYGTRKE